MSENDLVLIKRSDLVEMLREVVNEAVDQLRSDLGSADNIRKDYYTVKELCEMWSVCVGTLWRHEKMGHLHPKRIGRRVLFLKEEIDKINSLRPSSRRVTGNMRWQ